MTKYMTTIVQTRTKKNQVKAAIQVMDQILIAMKIFLMMKVLAYTVLGVDMKSFYHYSVESHRYTTSSTHLQMKFLLTLLVQLPCRSSRSGLKRMAITPHLRTRHRFKTTIVASQPRNLVLEKAPLIPQNSSVAQQL